MAKYSRGAGKKVKDAMHEMKRGQLKSGGSGKAVTSRKQAVAIGLSEAREKGEKVPPPKGSKSASKGTSKTAVNGGGRSKEDSKDNTGRTADQGRKTASGGTTKGGGANKATKASGKTKAASSPVSRGGSRRSASGKGGAKAAKKTSVPSKKGK